MNRIEAIQCGYNKKDIIRYKTEKETTHMQLKQLETVADKQLSLRKDLEQRNKILSDELMMFKNNTRLNVTMLIFSRQMISTKLTNKLKTKLNAI